MQKIFLYFSTLAIPLILELAPSGLSHFLDIRGDISNFLFLGFAIFILVVVLIMGT